MHDLKLVGLAGMASVVIAGLFYLLLLWIDGGLVDHDVRLAFTLVVFCACIPSLSIIIGSALNEDS